MEALIAALWLQLQAPSPRAAGRDILGQTIVCATVRGRVDGRRVTAFGCLNTDSGELAGGQLTRRGRLRCTLHGLTDARGCLITVGCGRTREVCPGDA